MQAHTATLNCKEQTHQHILKTESKARKQPWLQTMLSIITHAGSYSNTELQGANNNTYSRQKARQGRSHGCKQCSVSSHMQAHTATLNCTTNTQDRKQVRVKIYQLQRSAPDHIHSIKKGTYGPRSLLSSADNLLGLKVFFMKQLHFK